MSAPLRELVQSFGAWADLSPMLLAALSDDTRTGAAYMFVSPSRDAIVWPMAPSALLSLEGVVADWTKGRGRLAVIILTDRPGARYVAPISLAGE